MIFSMMQALLSSPRTWGCFCPPAAARCTGWVFPTHVGVFPYKESSAPWSESLPHARGGVSGCQTSRSKKPPSSPRTWGCFCGVVSSRHAHQVFPTHVGVFLCSAVVSYAPRRLPHARGGVSGSLFLFAGLQSSSPRTWGCFYSGEDVGGQSTVFPTHVGVFPDRLHCRAHRGCLPHARGGVSCAATKTAGPHTSSPRTWGCFCPARHALLRDAVFPTHVGVFPAGACRKPSTCSLPHARGGVSSMDQSIGKRCASSPRTWGCFRRADCTRDTLSVFPTHVGVFPRRVCVLRPSKSLPHARGGVSAVHQARQLMEQSSPRTWGCFSWPRATWRHQDVFPTHVGVFLKKRKPSRRASSLPHARGGVSRCQGLPPADCPSSPRTWGCFSHAGTVLVGAVVFPTHVGVFLKRIKGGSVSKGLPHARGGVSA